MKVSVRIAQPGDLDLCISAYKIWNYSPGIGADDTVLLAETRGDLIGVVRIARENGTLVLRGMRIAEPWQRRGVGSGMLKALADWLGGSECYCVPYSHLTEFYGLIGFEEIAAAASPPFLAARLEEYGRRGLNVTIMRRKTTCTTPDRQAS